MTRVILASASPGRRRVLRQAGIDPLVIVSGVDEDAIVAGLPEHSGPGEIANALAAAKAVAVIETLGAGLRVDSVVIGCDSMLWIDGELRGKPGSVAAAREAWRSMAGRSGELFTGHCVVRLRDGAVEHRLIESSSTTVYFARPSAHEMDRYLDSGEPLNVAGAFTLDGLGGWFLDRVEGDASTVIGIGLPIVRTLLQRVGLSVADLWRTNPL